MSNELDDVTGLLAKAQQRPELWYPTNKLRWLRSVNGAVTTLQQVWVSNHGREEWREIPTVDDQLVDE